MKAPSVPKVLVVDDDTALLQALPDMLRLRMGEIHIDTTDSAPAAVERIVATDYDAIISDIKMPGMDGLALLERIRTLRPATPTMLITGHGEHDLAVRALRGGAYDFIQKPIDRDYFIASLKRAVQLRYLSRQVEDQRLALERYAISLEHMVEQRSRELADASRVKDHFLSTAAHELRDPLTSIKLHMQLTGLALERAGVALPKSWENMHRAIARMDMLINDLVDAVRIASGKLKLHLQRCDVRAVCTQLASEKEVSTGRVIVVNIPEEPLEVRADVDRLIQVLSNLLANAIIYCPSGRPVVSAERAKEEIIISVMDQGVGIPREHLPHIFEQFYQAPVVMAPSGSPTAGVGLGLGLFISREIVEQHGGRIWAESTVGEGSRFFVALRAAPVASRRRSEQQTQGVAE